MNADDGSGTAPLKPDAPLSRALPPIHSDSAVKETDRREGPRGRNGGAMARIAPQCLRSVCLSPTAALLHHLNMPGAPQPCEEKKRLRAAYAEALDKLSEATAALRWAQYGPELLDALQKTQQARTKHDTARRALEDHRTTHGC